MKLGAWAWSSPILTPWPSTPVLVVAPSCHSSPPLSSPLSSPPSSPLSSPPGPHHECSPPRRASTEDAPRRRIAQWSCLPGPPPQSAATTRAVLHACSSSSRRASSGSHLASCTRVRRSKRPGKTHRDKYHESLRDVGGLYLAGSGQRQQ